MTDKDKLRIIINEVCDYFKVDERQLRSNSRKRQVTEPRYTVFYMARKLTGLSLNDLGREFNKDHATVLHGQNLIKNLVKFDGFGDNTTVLFSSVKTKFKDNNTYDFDRWILSMGIMITNN